MLQDARPLWVCALTPLALAGEIAAMMSAYAFSTLSAVRFWAGSEEGPQVTAQNPPSLHKSPYILKINQHSHSRHPIVHLLVNVDTCPISELSSCPGTMLTRATFSHSSCWYKPNPRLARAARPARGHRVTAAAAGGECNVPFCNVMSCCKPTWWSVRGPR